MKNMEFGHERPVLTAAALALALTAGAAGTGCATAQTATRATCRDVAAIEAAVKAKLAKNARLAAGTSVRVNQSNGVVTLSGRVASKEDRAAAGRLASSVRGVTVVYNEIDVDDPLR